MSRSYCNSGQIFPNMNAFNATYIDDSRWVSDRWWWCKPTRLNEGEERRVSKWDNGRGCRRFVTMMIDNRLRSLFLWWMNSFLLPIELHHFENGKSYAPTGSRTRVYEVGVHNVTVTLSAREVGALNNSVYIFYHIFTHLQIWCELAVYLIFDRSNW